MSPTESFKETLLELISKNPGLHFRELQRQTGSATGKLDYHLYQLEREGRIVSRKDDRNVRFFSNESGTISERTIAYYMRIKYGKEVMFGALMNHQSYIAIDISDRQKNILESMEKDGLVTTSLEGKFIRIVLVDREAIIKFLKKFGKSFIDSIALSILDLIDDLKY